MNEEEKLEGKLKDIPSIVPMPPGQAVQVVAVAGQSTDWQQLEETNQLLRAILICLCNQNDIQFDDVMSLAGTINSNLGLSS